MKPFHPITINSSIFLLITLTLNCPLRCQCELIDPGFMFGYEKPNSNHQLPDIADVADNKNHPSSLFPSILTPSDNAWFTEDSSCSMGTGIVLKRIVRMLFNHVDRLQPNELDDEFMYQSTISYEDYLNMIKFLNDQKLNCASLHGLDKLLSSILSDAEVRRPSQTNPFDRLLTNPFGINNWENDSLLGALQNWPNAYLTVILIIVCLTTWFLKNVAGYGEWTSNVLGIILPGFLQYYMYQNWLSMNSHQEKLERCENPSYFSSMLTYFNYDYNNCRGLDSKPAMFVTNVGKVTVEYFSELIFHPISALMSKIGSGSQSYLNAFTGWSAFAAHFHLIAIYIGVFSFFIYSFKAIVTSVMSRTVSRSSRTNQRMIQSSSSNKNAIMSPRKRSNYQGNSNGSSSIRKNKNQLK